MEKEIQGIVVVNRRGFLRGIIGLGLAAFGDSLFWKPRPAWGAKKVVKLAFIGPLSGGTASNGLGGRNSFLLALQERNADPKARYRYEPVILDDECKPTVGVQAALKAGSDPEVIAAVAHYCSVVAIATVDTFHKLGLPAMVWGAVLPEITYGHNYVEITRINGTLDIQNTFAAEFAVKRLGFKTFAVMHDTTDYGRSHAKYFVPAVERNGGKVLIQVGTAKDQQDYTAELTRIRALKPEVIYFGGLTPDGVRIKVQMDKLGIRAQFQGTSGIKSETFLQEARESAEGVYCFAEAPPTEDLPKGRRFIEAYRKAGFKEPWEAYGPFAYAAAHLVMDAIEQVGPDRAKVAKTLKRMRKQETILGPVRFDEHGQNIIPLITCYVAQDGQWVPWQKSEYATGRRILPGQRFRREQA